jgi:hypothetical protein
MCGWNGAVSGDARWGEGLAGLDEDYSEASGRPRGAWDVSRDWGGSDGDGVKMVVGGYRFVK